MTKYNFAANQQEQQQFSPCRRSIIQLPGRAITVFEEEGRDQQRSSFDFAAQIANNKSAKCDSQPFFVMDTGRISELVDLFCVNLPRVHPFYSLKCNSDPVLLRLLASNTSIGFCCNSVEDFRNALEHVPAHRVMCANPCLTRSLLTQADEQNVELLCFESERDLDRILSNYPDSKLLLRVCMNPESEDPNALFGIPLDKAAELLQLSADLGLNCVGIAFSVGADCIRPSAYEFAIACSARLFQIGLSMGLKMGVLNIGGGFASLSTEWQHNHFMELCVEINKSLDLHFPPDTFGSGMNIIATPGRFFAGSVFSLVTNVIGKRCTDASYVTNNDFDSGNTAFLYQINESYYGTFGCRMVTNCEPHCTPLFEKDNSAAGNVYGSVFGLMGFDEPNTDDVVQPICHFRQLDIGDWLIWTNMGAYTFGNRGSLDDEDEDEYGRGRFPSPHVFYFSSRKNWENVSRRLSTDDVEMMYSSDAEESSDGSCGEAMSGQSDAEEESDGGRDGEEDEMRRGETDCDDDEDDEFWPIGWSLKLDE